MNQLEFLLSLGYMVPFSITRGCTRPTNSELRRWLDQSSVHINGKPTTNWRAPMEFPCTSLVFFPKSRRRTTIY